MSKRYIPQTPNNDFVYPNNDKVEYDIEIYHEINDNVPIGIVSGLTLSYNTEVAPPYDLVLEFYWSYDRNGSIPSFRENGNQSLLSVHMLTPDQEYFKPWRIVTSRSNTVSGDTFSGTLSTNVPTSFFQVDSWPAGEYTFEFRFVGLRENYIICQTASLSAIPTPTPTPTVTGGPPTPTPTAGEITPTPTEVTPTPTPVTGICVTNYSAAMAPCIGGTLDEYMEGSIELSAVTPVEATFQLSVGYIDGTPSGNCNNTLVYETLTVTVEAGQSSGLLTCPYAPFINSNGATICTVEYLTGDYPLCCTTWELVGSTVSGELLAVAYNDCNGVAQEVTVGWNATPQTQYICAQIGTVEIIDQGLGTSATNLGTSCG